MDIQSSPFFEYSGHSLIKLFSDTQIHQRIFPGLAALNSAESVERILKKSGTRRDFFLWEIPCFWLVGRELWEDFSDQVHSILLQAPHTHWDVFNPIIYEYDELGDRYLVSSRGPELENQYKPVSFVWSGKEILPYEWIDCSVKLDRLELLNCYKVIAQLFHTIARYDLPVGLGVSFRFKQQLTDVSIDSLEIPLPSTQEAFYGKASQIIRESDRTRLKEVGAEDADIERVGWYLVGDGLGLLTDDDVDLLRLCIREGIALNLDGLGSLLSR